MLNIVTYTVRKTKSNCQLLIDSQKDHTFLQNIMGMVTGM